MCSGLVSLEGLVPPAELTPPEPPELRGAFAQLDADDVSPSETIGRLLGGGDEAAAARWLYLVRSSAAREVVCCSVHLHHIVPLITHIDDFRARAKAGLELGYRLIAPFGSKSLLGAPHWRALLALAEHLAPRDDEAAAECAGRCARQDAWAAAHAFEKPGLATLLLRQAVVILGGVDLYAGVPVQCMADLTMDAREAHLRVPPGARHADRSLQRLFHAFGRTEETRASGGAVASSEANLSAAGTAVAAAGAADVAEIVRIVVGAVFCAGGECSLADVHARLAELGVVGASPEEVEAARDRTLHQMARLRSRGGRDDDAGGRDDDTGCTGGGWGGRA